MRGVGQVDGQLCDLPVLVVYEYEEEDEADETGHESEETKEQTLGGADAVSFGVRRHLAASNAHTIVILAPIPEK